jgi:hypothetical protein
MKSPAPNPQVATRASLAGRIVRFIDRLNAEGRDPDRWESEHVQTALGFLQQRRFADGEYALILAERAAEHRSGKQLAFLRQTYESPTRWHLAARLKAVLDRDET